MAPMYNVSMIVWNEFQYDARVLKEAESLQSAGYMVTVYALHTPEVTKERERLNSGVKVVRVRSPFWRCRKRNILLLQIANQSTANPVGTISLKALLRIIDRIWTHVELSRQMFKSKPKIIHSHDVNTLPTAWFTTLLSGASLVYDAHEISTDREGYASLRKLVGWIEKNLMPRAGATITTTDTRAKFFARAYSIPRPLVLQNRPRLTFVERSQRIRDELGLKGSWPIVLYQGGLQPGRGLERLVDCASQVLNAHLVFIGGGSLEPTLKKRVRLLGTENRIHFIPVVSLQDLPSYTASADIGVQPIENTCLNHFSTDSNKLFEYVMASLPVVATNLPEIRKIVYQFNLGIVVPPADSDALTQAIQRMVVDVNLRQAFSENATQARLTLNWEAQEKRLIELYQAVSER